MLIHFTLKLFSEANSMSRSKRHSSGIWSEYRASSGVLNGKNLSANKQQEELIHLWYYRWHCQAA